MSTNGNGNDRTVYRQLAGQAESLAAIDEVIGTARRSLCIFDFTLALRGYGSAAQGPAAANASPFRKNSPRV